MPTNVLQVTTVNRIRRHGILCEKLACTHEMPHIIACPMNRPIWREPTLLPNSFVVGIDNSAAVSEHLHGRWLEEGP